MSEHYGRGTIDISPWRAQGSVMEGGRLYGLTDALKQPLLVYSELDRRLY